MQSQLGYSIQFYGKSNTIYCLIHSIIKIQSSSKWLVRKMCKPIEVYIFNFTDTIRNCYWVTILNFDSSIKATIALIPVASGTSRSLNARWIPPLLDNFTLIILVVSIPMALITSIRFDILLSSKTGIPVLCLNSLTHSDLIY